MHTHPSFQAPTSPAFSVFGILLVASRELFSTLIFCRLQSTHIPPRSGSWTDTTLDPISATSPAFSQQVEHTLAQTQLRRLHHTWPTIRQSSLYFYRHACPTTFPYSPFRVARSTTSPAIGKKRMSGGCSEKRPSRRTRSRMVLDLGTPVGGPGGEAEEQVETISPETLNWCVISMSVVAFFLLSCSVFCVVQSMN